MKPLLFRACKAKTVSKFVEHIKAEQMKSLGIDLSANQIYSVLMTGAKVEPNILSTYRDPIPKQPEATALMQFFRNIFSEILDRTKPDIVTYRVALSAGQAIKKLDQYPNLYFSYGVLNLICADKKIQAFPTHIGAFTKKFLGSSQEKEQFADRTFGVHAPAWASKRLAALSAWSALP